MGNFFYFYTMIKFPFDAKHNYILIIVPTRSVYSLEHSQILRANVVYKIISYIPFKWACVKHRIDSPSNIAYSDIKDLIGGILLDCCSFNLDVTFEEIHLRLIKHFKALNHYTLAKTLCKTVDEDFFDFINNHIDDKKYFFP